MFIGGVISIWIRPPQEKCTHILELVALTVVQIETFNGLVVLEIDIHFDN